MSYRAKLDAAVKQWSIDLGDWGGFGGYYPGVPKFKVGDYLSLLAYCTEGVIAMIKSRSDGEILYEGSTLTSVGNGITPEVYLSKTTPAPGRTAEYRMLKVGSFVGGPYVPNLHYQASAVMPIRLWQVMVDTVSRIVAKYPLGSVGPDYDSAAVLSHTEAICDALDALNELPSSNWNLITTGVADYTKAVASLGKETVKDAAAVVGAAAAEGAELAGEAGGKFFGSFLNQAGITALAVAAAAVYLYLR